MDMVTINLFVVLEMVIILTITVFILKRRNNQLHQQLQALEKRVPGEVDGFASIESGYLPYLEKQILDTRARLELSETEAGSDSSLPEALKQRLVLLEAEKKVTELCNDYPRRRWEHVTELFTPQTPQQDVDEPDTQPDEDIEEPGGIEEDPLAQAQKRIKSLEKFRDHFFQMKRQVKDLQGARQRLVDKLEVLMPDAERSEELQALLDDLSNKNARLQEQVDQLESQADELEPNSSAEVMPTEHRQESFTQLCSALGQQGDVIHSIMQVIGKGRGQSSPEILEQIEKQLKELEQKYCEATTCIEIMNQENERLQDKVGRKEQRIERAEAEKNESVADLQDQVDKQKRKMSELHDLVGDLQLEAEKAEELKARLNQFDLASRDMNMCIQVLEEENEFLQEQIRSLLQLEEDESVYNQHANNEELEQQIEALKAQLEEVTRQAKEAEERYMSLEKEYLTLYEEANT